MNAEVKALWLEALRSGRFKKGKGALAPGAYRYENDDSIFGVPVADWTKDDGRRCCLGVLCEIAKDQGVIESYSPNGSYLPEEVAVWAEVAPDPRISLWEEDEYEEHTFREISAYNDDFLSGEDFTKIASVIEEQL